MRKIVGTAVVILALFMMCTAGSAQSTERRRVGVESHRRAVTHHVHHHYPKRHRTKMQHAKIIGGTAKTGASVGGMIGGPPGMAVGAAAGAAAGTAYDVKTRRVKPKKRAS